VGGIDGLWGCNGCIVVGVVKLRLLRREGNSKLKRFHILTCFSSTYCGS
jgi:hypothetical protein